MKKLPGSCKAWTTVWTGKANEFERSAREILYHLIDTPDKWLDAAVEGILNGDTPHIDIVSDYLHLIPGRTGKDIRQILREIEVILLNTKQSVMLATEEDLEQKKKLA